VEQDKVAGIVVLGINSLFSELSFLLFAGHWATPVNIKKSYSGCFTMPMYQNVLSMFYYTAIWGL
jgi:hypothetical protein